MSVIFCPLCKKRKARQAADWWEIHCKYCGATFNLVNILATISQQELEDAAAGMNITKEELASLFIDENKMRQGGVN